VAAANPAPGGLAAARGRRGFFRATRWRIGLQNVDLKTERVAITYRLLFAYPFVRPESEQNSSHIETRCGLESVPRSILICEGCSIRRRFKIGIQYSRRMLYARTQVPPIPWDASSMAAAGAAPPARACLWRPGGGTGHRRGVFSGCPFPGWKPACPRSGAAFPFRPAAPSSCLAVADVK
jgi:hypothetical protein